MLLRSRPIPSFYPCKAWVHKNDICMGFQVHFIDYVIIKTLFEDYTIEPSEIGTTSEQRTTDLFPKCPSFGGSTV